MHNEKNKKETESDIKKMKKDLFFLNKTKIAEKTKIHPTTINNFCNGIYNLSSEYHLKVRNALDEIAREILNKK